MDMIRLSPLYKSLLFEYLVGYYACYSSGIQCSSTTWETDGGRKSEWITASVVSGDFLPVPNLLKGWFGLPVAFSSWNSLQASFIRFFSCSESTAFTSRSLQLSSNNGHRKNWANLQRFKEQQYRSLCIIKLPMCHFQYFKILPFQFWVKRRFRLCTTICTHTKGAMMKTICICSKWEQLPCKLGNNKKT